MSRIAPARFMPLMLTAGLLALGCFDTAQAQNLTVSSTTLNYNTSPGVNPPTQTISTSSTGGSIDFNVAYSVPWISAATQAFDPSSGISGQTLTVQVTSSSLASGNYSSTVTLTPTNGSPAVVITVNVSISGSGNSTYVLTPSLSNLYFAYQLGQSGPASQSVQISSSGISLPITSVTPSLTLSSTCPAGWLTVVTSGSSTPATITASVVTAGLGAGTCGATITVTSSTTGNATTTIGIPVLVYVSANPVLNVAVPAGLTAVTLHQTDAPAVFNVILTSSNPAVPLNFTAVASSAAWLGAPAPSIGSTPQSLYIQITPGSVIPAGTYNGSITINAPTLFQPFVIPIVFTLLPSNAITISPTGAQSFTELQGGSLPTPITLTLSGSSSASFTTSVSAGPTVDWLQVTPATGTISPSSVSTISLSVAPNTLPQGTYSNQVTLTFQPSSIPPITIFVGLTVAPPAAAIVTTPATLSFNYQSGGPAPAAQSVSVSNPAPNVALQYTVSSISDSWIVVSPTTGTTPGTLSVSVTPQNLQPGTYNGSFTLSASGVPTLTETVSLFISASQTPQPFIVGNNSSGVGSQLAPGEIIFIKGSNLGPTPGVVGAGTSLGDVTVTFNGVPGTLLYVSASQIDVTVPYGIAGESSANLVVSYQSVPSAAIQLPVVSAALGLSTLSQTGSGQAAALNLSGPNGYNTPTTPALEGSYISVYGTGGGQTSPASTDGEVSPVNSLLPLVLQPYVTATIGGKAATVQFAGAAPGEITGVVQFNIQVPMGVSGTALPIVITINGSTLVQSQAGVTVSVQ